LLGAFMDEPACRMELFTLLGARLRNGPG
jgi:hypothetical protein